MAKVPPPGRKGEPPAADDTVGNLEKCETSNLSFWVPRAFQREFGMFAAMQGKRQTGVLYEAFDLLKRKLESGQ
jgi:hypothetical protein